MTDKKKSKLEKIGYINKLPKNADKYDYENISIINKSGKKIILYRNIKRRKEIDDTSNFDNSWDVFNSLL